MVRRRAVRAGLAVLALVAGSLLAGCGVVVRAVTGDRLEPPDAIVATITLPAQRPLDATERAWAAAAWRYFSSHSDPRTGLADSVGGYHSATLWEIGDAIMATLAAHRLDLIDTRARDERLAAIVATVGRLPLAYGRLPSRTTDTATGLPREGVAPGWTGWSAIDVGRLLVALRLVHHLVPALAPAAQAAVDRFDLCAAVDIQGGLYATDGVAGPDRRYRESSRGYEAYSAIGFRLWGIAANSPPQRSGLVLVSGVPFASAPESGTAQGSGPVLTGPSGLSGVELGWAAPAPSSDFTLALRISRAHASRRTDTGLPGARNDYLRGEAPYFLYGTIAYDGAAWPTLLPDGTSRPDLAFISTRAAFLLWALWPDTHGTLPKALPEPGAEQAGWGEGLYENGAPEPLRSASTNAIVLEALSFRAGGPIRGKDLAIWSLRSCGAD